MTINQAGLDLIKKWEGFEPRTYIDAAGVPTIGYGTTARAGVGVIPLPGMEISEKQAEKYLLMALAKFADRIRPHVRKPANENEWAAFLSLAYNIGPHAFVNSTALKRFNEGDKAGAAEAMLWFNKAGGRVLRGLERRRKAEVALFKTPVQPAPASLWARILTFLRRAA